MATALRLPRPEQALPGRSSEMPVPASHFVNEHPIAPPFPSGLEYAVDEIPDGDRLTLGDEVGFS